MCLRCWTYSMQPHHSLHPGWFSVASSPGLPRLLWCKSLGRPGNEASLPCATLRTVSHFMKYKPVGVARPVMEEIETFNGVLVHSESEMRKTIGSNKEVAVSQTHALLSVLIVCPIYSSHLFKYRNQLQPSWRTMVSMMRMSTCFVSSLTPSCASTM